MRRSDISFVLLSAALLGMLFWWWNASYSAEKAVLGDRLDVKLADWRTSRIRSSLEFLTTDSTSFMQVGNIADVEPGVKVDLVNQRIIHLDSIKVTTQTSNTPPLLKFDHLTQVLNGGLSMGASAHEIDSVLSAIGAALGVHLRLVAIESSAIMPPDTIGRFFRTATEQFKVVNKVSSTNSSVEWSSTRPEYIFVEGYIPVLLGRIIPELAVGCLLLVGLFAFYGLVRRDLHRREAALVEKDRLIANVAHELKTPIAVVGVALEALENFGADADPERRRRYIKTSREELGRLELLAERALGTLLLEAATPPDLVAEPVNLVMLAEASWSSLSLKHHLPEILTTTSNTSQNSIVVGDRLLLRHLLDNLLENAVKYGRNVEATRLDFSATPSSVSFTIEDDGPGIPLAERERVFEKFYRIQTDNEGHHVKGHGLGLSYALQIVRRHKGTITINSNPTTQGTAVTVTLPRQ